MPPQRREVLLQFRMPALGGRQPQGQRVAAYAASATVQQPALAPDHVAVARHHLCGPGRGIVQAFQVAGRGEGLIVLQLVQHEKTFSTVGAGPA